MSIDRGKAGTWLDNMRGLFYFAIFSATETFRCQHSVFRFDTIKKVSCQTQLIVYSLTFKYLNIFIFSFFQRKITID